MDGLDEPVPALLEPERLHHADIDSSVWDKAAVAFRDCLLQWAEGRGRSNVRKAWAPVIVLWSQRLKAGYLDKASVFFFSKTHRVCKIMAGGANVILIF